MTSTQPKWKVLVCSVLIGGIFFAGLNIFAVEKVPQGFEAANVDWTVHKGAVLNIFLNKHPFTEALVPMIPSFEKLTGIRVNFEILPEEEYFTKLFVDLSSGTGFMDVFMIGEPISWKPVAAGWIEQLDPYIENPKLTDKKWYDLDDFFPIAINAYRFEKEALGYGNYGKGPLWAIPVTQENMILTYRKDLFQKYGLVVPGSWPELVDTAQKLTREGIYGIVSRGIRSWSTGYNGYRNGVWSYGGRDFDENMRPVVNSPEVVEFTKLWVELQSKCTPPGLMDTTWYDAKQKFTVGLAAMIIDCDFFSSTYQNPKVSKIAGKLGYAHTPPGPKGIYEDQWNWALAINSASDQKEAAWLFIEFATCKEGMKRATIDFWNMNPTRRSVWNNSDLVERTAKWENYRRVFEESIDKYSSILVSINPEWPTCGDIWAVAVQKAIMGADVKTQLDRAAREMAKVMERAGYYK